ncbi:hypothetical protein D3C81_1126450 [compost metagenome]
MLQHPLEDQLAPVTLGLLALQRLGQVGGLIAQAQVELLQALQLLGQGEALAGFLLVAVFNPLLERLDALLERVEQLPQVLLAGLGEALLTLVEDLGRHFRKLGAQLIPRALEIVKALLMAFLLFTQLGAQGRAVGIQTAQFGLAGAAFDLPGMGSVTGVVTVDLQQLQLTGLRRQRRLLGRIGLAQVTDFVATGVELGEQAFLGHLRTAQTLLEQGRLRLTGGLPSLLGKHPSQARHCGHHDTQHDAGQIQRHYHPNTPS